MPLHAAGPRHLRDALAHVTAVVEREMNAATDNPLVFADTGEVHLRRQLPRPADRPGRRPALRRRGRPEQHQRAPRREPGQSRPERPARLPDAAPRPQLRHDARAGVGGGAGLGEQGGVVPGQRRFDPDLGQPRGPRFDGHRWRRANVARSSPTPRACWRARCCAPPRDWSFTGRCGRAGASRRPISMSASTSGRWDATARCTAIWKRSSG